MSSQGPLSPGTLTSVALGTVAWSNPTNASSSNDSYATCVLPQEATSHYLKCTNFGFSIPADAHVTGIQVEVERKASAILSISDQMYLVIGNSVVATTAQFGPTWPTTDTYYDYGSSTQMWNLGGGGIGPAEINASNFGIALFCFNEALSSVTCSIDHVRVTVHYETFVSGPNSPGTLATQVDNSDTSISNPGNAAASDNTYAAATFLVTINVRSDRLNCTNFGFSIPSSHIIKGIKVEAEVNSTLLSTCRDYKCQLIKGGTIQTANKATLTSFPTTDTYLVYGGEYDLWDDTWTPADINASNFGVSYQFESFSTAVGNVDHIRITVYTSESRIGSLSAVGIGR